MAEIIPTLNSCLSRMTAGEKRIARSLTENLENDYWIWYDVSIGEKQLRPDFTVLHPLRGLLVLEVKDWKIDTIQDVNRNTFTISTENGIKAVNNPLNQARKYILAINNLLCHDRDLVHPTGKYQGHLICPYGYGVVLTNITRSVFNDNELNTILDEHLVICQDEIRPSDPMQLQKRLWDMYPYSFDRAVTPHQVDRIRWLMFPECRLPSKQLSLFLADHAIDSPAPDLELDRSIPPVEIPTELIKIFDRKQEVVARSLNPGHQVIHGVAGSGKTMILLYRCYYLATLNPQKPILVICFNVALASRLREIITSQNLGGIVHVRHFHGWCIDQLRRHRLPLPPQADNYIQSLEQSVLQAIESGQIPASQYSSILIDEGHDFEPAWFKMLTYTLDEQESLLLLYDDAQNLYGTQQKRRKFSFKSVGVKAQGRTSILKTNYRNTIEVLNLAYEFAKDEMQSSSLADEDRPVLIQPLSSGRHGTIPQQSLHRSFADEVQYVVAMARLSHSEGVPWKEIGIFHRLKFMGEIIYKQFQQAGIPIEWASSDRNSHHSQSKIDGIQLMTMHSCKGLEFSTVILPGLGYLPNPKSLLADEARLLYVAMTRSTERLILSYHQKSDFVKRLQLLDGKCLICDHVAIAKALDSCQKSDFSNN